jgi:hypothetical protein
LWFIEITPVKISYNLSAPLLSLRAVKISYNLSAPLLSLRAPKPTRAGRLNRLALDPCTPMHPHDMLLSDREKGRGKDRNIHATPLPTSASSPLATSSPAASCAANSPRDAPLRVNSTLSACPPARRLRMSARPLVRTDPARARLVDCSALPLSCYKPCPPLHRCPALPCLVASSLPFCPVLKGRS